MVETARRREIEEAASSLFRERGYSGTSVRDIARALDIQGASLYAHVTSKQDVLWSIVERMATRFETSAAAVLAATGQDQSGGPATQLAALVRNHVIVVTDDIERASVFVHEWRSLSSDHRAEMARRRDAYEGRFRAVIAAGTAAGVFAPVDPAVTASYILTALNGLVAWYRPAGRLKPETLADSFAELSMRAVLSTGPTGDHGTSVAGSARSTGTGGAG
ncbi:MAG TPA: TetR/AcrR family transcriptional regulator [Candidatus Limnocylindrales bacterium]